MSSRVIIEATANGWTTTVFGADGKELAQQVMIKCDWGWKSIGKHTEFTDPMEAYPDLLDAIEQQSPDEMSKALGEEMES